MKMRDRDATRAAFDERSVIRPCRAGEADAILAIINEAAEAYRGVIPADCWHEPYMSEASLHSELAAGVSFVGYAVDRVLAGVMGIQSVRNVDLIRHAYVRTSAQGRGVGSALIAALRARTTRPVLVGTWAAAVWAVAFYERHGFSLTSEATKETLLRAYWTVPPRQREVSVVLSAPALTDDAARQLMAAASGDRAS
jgi:GNAT superfamily N-acetyltransferase